MKKVEKPKKPLIFYYLIALIILVLLNTFLFPNILGKNKVKEVDYGTFLTMVEGKEVSKVELNGDTIYFTDNSEEPKYYETTTFDDPNLVNRLEDAGCEFGRVAQQEMNPLLSFFLVWILPLLIFWARTVACKEDDGQDGWRCSRKSSSCSSERAMRRFMWNLQQESLSRM